ncbi:neuronal acetylcholine receptor subunit alpha-3-like [Zophobas morio]|uniref:neuronal acetylcholine receptor subunit alpha-3-like n=1 Tax=Zophobas morio TaxID=2755281 RepID=UPI0030832734
MLVQVLLTLLLLSTAKTDDDCRSDKSKLAPVRLRKRLLCDYDKDTRPIRDHTKPVQLVMQLMLKYYAYDMHDNSFTIDSWLALRWTDEHLTWNPDDYESLKRIHLSHTDIWMPDLSIYNRRTQGGDQSAIDSVTCIVANTGQVVCVPSTSHSTICTSDLTKFPFDTHNCTVRFGSWVHSGEELDLQISKDALNTDDLIYNGEWDLIDTNVFKHPGIYKCCPNNTYPSINYSFKIQRISGAHTASVILPAFALVIITLVSLWVAPNNPQRLNLCYVNIISEFLYIQYVSWLIPMNGDRVPLILLFARDSLLLSAFTIMFSLVLASMVENKKTTPAWISRVVSVLIAFKPGQVVLLGDSSFKGLDNEHGDDDVTAIINNKDTTTSLNTEWLMFAKILDRLCFLIYVIVYLCMFIAFIP